jgi:indolepyruvate ferredoxin oxidoreductase
MTKSVVRLDDKYTQAGGRVYLSSIQALVRLPLDQARRDRAAGLRTTGFISGYRGSPLGTYDAALWAAQKLLDEHDVRFQPGLNEELAATALRGTQQLAWFGASRYEGVFSLWYGKGLGTDRAMESLKLGNLEGAAARGGALIVSGDDHGGKSSASAHQSEHTLIAAMIPVLYPADAAEIIEFGLAGWALSRCSGAYVGLKCVTDTLDYSASVALPDPLRTYIEPEHATQQHLQALAPPLAMEDWTVNRRLPAVQAFVRANGLDRIVLDAPQRTLAIVAAGKVYRDLREALDQLGLDTGRCAALGIRVYKPALVWPLDPEGLRAFAAGSRELLVIEEKRPVIEEQAAGILYGLPAERRPALAGKRTPDGAVLLSAVGELQPGAVRAALLARLRALGLADAGIEARAAQFDALARHASDIGGSARRRPAFYCSGCPHNTGTKLPDGSIAISAVGCHGLAAFMPERRTMMPMQMGGDGMPWVSVGPLVEAPHVFQNMGDGTYAHSGVLAIRAAVAARANMTFKILYNDAVAMTGGQPVEGQPSPLAITRQMLAEGVAPVVIVSEEPEQFSGTNRPPAGVRVLHRDALDAVQRELRECKGVSGLIYVQTCAAEKRRRRKRGLMPDPQTRVFINPAVCEGCGDCSTQSNCMSVQPLETEFGRKRVIDQSNCNKDYSCLKGFCPSFVTVEGARITRRKPAAGDDVEREIAALPPPAVASAEGAYGILVTGIGGTGVLTLGALIGMAAHLEGKAVSVMDVTGMAQKGGAVTSHVRVAASQQPLHSARLDLGMCDLLLACDMLVAAGPEVLKTLVPGASAAVLNSDVAPTGEFQTRRDLDLGGAGFEALIRKAVGDDAIHRLPATRLATRHVGDSIATNLLMLGYALQKGLVPVSLDALEQAIRLHGSNVESNLRVLALGRLAAHRPEILDGRDPAAAMQEKLSTLSGVLESRTRLLRDYQNDDYARLYRAFVDGVQQRLRARGVAAAEVFARAVALTLARLMAYKDEYEVARLHADPAFAAALREQFEGCREPGATAVRASTGSATGCCRCFTYCGISASCAVRSSIPSAGCTSVVSSAR